MFKKYFILFFLLATTMTRAVEPIKEYVDHPLNSISNISFEAVEITTEDNFILKSWICMPAKEVDKHRVFVLAYGDSGNMSYYVRQVLEMVKQGYTIVMFDYRGYGESQAFEMETTMLYYDEFVTDLKAVVDYSKTRFKQPVGVWALSMGSIPATLLYSQDKFDYMVVEGFVSSPTLIIEKVKSHLQQDYKLPPSATDYEKALSRLSVPMLLFAGDRDGLTTPDESKRAKYLNAKNELVFFKGTHLQGFQALSNEYHGQRYVEAIDSFFDINLSSK